MSCVISCMAVNGVYVWSHNLPGDLVPGTTGLRYVMLGPWGLLIGMRVHSQYLEVYKSRVSEGRYIEL